MIIKCGRKPARLAGRRLERKLRLVDVANPTPTRSYTFFNVTFGGVEVRKDRSLVGRKDTGAADILLDKPTISGIHGELSFEDGVFRYTDMGSTNGSFYYEGDARLKMMPGEPREMGCGDRVRLASLDARLTVERRAQGGGRV